MGVADCIARTAYGWECCLTLVCIHTLSSVSAKQSKPTVLLSFLPSGVSLPLGNQHVRGEVSGKGR